MSDTNLFQNSDLVIPIALIAFALWLIFVWKEWEKPTKKRFYLNSIIALITISSFAMLALKPLSNQVIHAKTGVLITNGFDQNRLDSLKNTMGGIRTVKYKMNKPIGKVLDSLSSLFVLGEGIQPFDFWQFENRSVTYLGTNLSDGVLDLKYSQENVLGEYLKVMGRYRNPQINNRLVLQDLKGHSLDSIVFSSRETQNFELLTSLKAKGRFVFKLVEKDSLGETISSEPLPFRVVESTKLKVLLVNGFPTFETKYLKNYLSEMGHEVVVRSQLTRGRYKFEYFNTKRKPIYRLNEKELEDFDLLVIDANSFRNLSLGTWTSIEKSVKNNGLGLFVQPGSGWFGRSSDRLRLEFERDGVSKVVWNKFPNTTLEKLPYKFNENLSFEEIHSSSKGTLSAYKRIEKGRVGTTLVQNSYQLQLDGKMKAYRQFWSDIVKKLSKRGKQHSEWEKQDKFPLENHPFEFKLRTTVEHPKVFADDGNRIPLKQSIDIPSLWTGTTYPRHQGWNKLYLDPASDAVLDYYVVDSLSWIGVKASALQMRNKRYFSKSHVEPQKVVSNTPIEPLWFFLLGVMGLGYLWLHPKIFPN